MGRHWGAAQVPRFLVAIALLVVGVFVAVLILRYADAYDHTVAYGSLLDVPSAPRTIVNLSALLMLVLSVTLTRLTWRSLAQSRVQRRIVAGATALSLLSLLTLVFFSPFESNGVWGNNGAVAVSDQARVGAYMSLTQCFVALAYCLLFGFADRPPRDQAEGKAG